jgi:hypothetical protein
VILFTYIIFVQCSGNNYFSKNNNSDTLFVDKEKYPYTFYEPNPNSKYKLFNNLAELKFCSGNDTTLDTKWYQIERFNNKYVFFLDSEFGGINKYLFCAQYFYEILNSGDNPLPKKIELKNKISTKEYLYILNSKHVIHIYIIDDKRGIAIMHNSRDGYKFMTSQKLSYDIPILSNYNKHTKIIDDVSFDEIDFDHILKQKGFNISRILNN